MNSYLREKLILTHLWITIREKYFHALHFRLNFTAIIAVATVYRDFCTLCQEEVWKGNNNSSACYLNLFHNYKNEDVFTLFCVFVADY
ncbi:unnamed protein product [Larinioides sclopetarius]|uniref:Uncharacterized protein n=1 Tax=Larinioides sclopetarius TaxID=280406 RepID=A0AAV2AL45_9ARAC